MGKVLSLQCVSMIPYLLVFIILVSMAVLEIVVQSSRIKFVAFVFSVSILVLFGGLRAVGVGADDQVYYQMFLKVPAIIEWVESDYRYSLTETRMEPGYIVFGALVRTIGDSSLVLFLTTTAFTVCISAIFYRKLSSYPILTLVLIFAHTYLYRDINQVRAAMAASLGLFWVMYLARGRLLSLFGAWSAILFHLASLSYLILIPLRRLRVTRKLSIGIVFLSFVIAILNLPSVLIDLIEGQSYLSSRITSYLENPKHMGSVSLFDASKYKEFVFLFIVFGFLEKTRNCVAVF